MTLAASSTPVTAGRMSRRFSCPRAFRRQSHRYDTDFECTITTFTAVVCNECYSTSAESVRRLTARATSGHDTAGAHYPSRLILKIALIGSRRAAALQRGRLGELATADDVIGADICVIEQNGDALGAATQLNKSADQPAAFTFSPSSYSKPNRTRTSHHANHVQAPAQSHLCSGDSNRRIFFCTSRAPQPLSHSAAARICSSCILLY